MFSQQWYSTSKVVTEKIMKYFDTQRVEFENHKLIHNDQNSNELERSSFFDT